jgi:Spherulation-specific family 4
VAIINPNSGPDPSGPDASYVTYMKKLANAGITMIGYVHSSYGNRSLSTVENEVDIYATKYGGMEGIFVDEASNSVSELSYYASLYKYIRSKSGYANVVINPGTSTDESYLSVSILLVFYLFCIIFILYQ